MSVTTVMKFRLKEGHKVWIARVLLLGMLGQCVPTHAAVELDPTGGGKTQVGVVGNVPLIQLAQPNASGISRNQFNRLDVGAEGMLLNNGTQTNQSTLTGTPIAKNPNYGSSAANMVLMEVSKVKSCLNGTVEMVGNRADLVVANPWGIQLNGAKFLNLSRLTLTTGASQWNGTNLTGFNVTTGKIEVLDKGLDASRVGLVDLLAKAITVQGTIRSGGYLNMVAGSHQFDYASGAVSLTGGTGTGFGIDANSLGSMYAGRISLITTDKGVGVNNQGLMMGLSDDITISSDGDVNYKDVVSGRNFGVKSDSGAIIGNGGSVVVKGDSIFLAKKDIAITGQMLSNNSVTAISQEGSFILGKAIKPTTESKAYLETGALMLGSKNGITLQNATVIANTDGVLESKGDITLNNADLSGNSLSIKTEKQVLLNTGVVNTGMGDITIQAARYQGTNSSLYAGQDITILSNGDVVQKDSVIDGLSVAVQAAGSIQNTGASAIMGEETIVLRGDQMLNEKDSMIDSYGAVVLQSKKLDNKGWIGSVGDMAIESDILSNAGSLDSVGSMTLRSVDNLNNTGKIRSDSLVQANVGLLTNAGKIYSDASSVVLKTSDRGLVNSGEIAAIMLGTLSSDGKIDNTGSISAAGGLGILAKQDLTNTGGLILGNQSVYLASELGSIVNQNLGLVVSTGQTVFLAGQNIRNIGSDVKSQSLVLQAGNVIENRAIPAKAAKIDSYGGPLSITSKQLINDGAYALINSNENALIQADIFTNSGSVLAGNEFIANIGNLDNRGAIASDGTIVLNTGAATTKLEGSIDAYEGLLITGKTLTNKANLNSNGILVIRTQDTFQNDTLGTLTGLDLIEVDAKGSIINLNKMESKGDMVLNAGLDIVHTGTPLKAADSGYFTTGRDAIFSGSTVEMGKDLMVDVARDFTVNALEKKTVATWDQWNSNMFKYDTTWQKSTVSAGGDTSVRTGRDWLIQSSIVDLKGNASIQTGQDLTLKADLQKTEVRQYLRKGSNNYYDLNSDFQNSVMTIGKDASINTGRDFTIDSSDFTIIGNASIDSKRDLNILSENSVEQHYFYERRGNKNVESNTVIEHAEGSRLKILGAFASIEAGRDILIEGSELTSTGRTELHAGGDIMVASAIETQSSMSVEKKKEWFHDKKKTYTAQKQTNIGSQLNLGDDSLIMSDKDITVMGSKIAVNGDGLIKAKGDVNIVSAQNTFFEETKKKTSGFIENSSSNKSNSSTTQVASDVQMSGNLAIVSDGTTRINGSSLQAGEEMMIDAKKGLVITAANNTKESVSQSQSNLIIYQKDELKIDTEMTALASKLDAKGDIILKTEGDLLIAGSQVNSTGGNITLSSLGKTTITSATQGTYSYAFKQEKGFTGFSLDLTRSSIDFSANFAGNSKTTEKTGVSQLSSLISAGGNVSVLSGQDTLILGSSLAAGGTMTVSGKSLKILNTDEMNSLMTKKGELKEKITASIGNSWLETAYQTKDAIQSVSDAQKAAQAAKKDPQAGADAGMYADINTTARVLQATLAVAQAAQLVKSVANSAGTAGSFGFYAALNSTTELTESSQKSSSTTAKASQLTSGGDMLLQAREDLGIKGSFAQSANGNVTIKGKNVTIEAASQTLTQSSNDSVHQYTKTLASTAPVQDGLGSFKDNQAQSKTTQTTYLLSGVKAENGTVKIVSESDILVAGAEIIGNNIEIAAMKGNLTVKSLQDVLEYRQGSQGIQVGQTNGFSVSEATKSSLWVNTQTKIVGTNSVALKANTLNNDGALIANITKDGIDGGNLSVIADQIIYNTLQDRNKASNYGISVGVSGAGSPPQSANGSTTIGASYSGLNQAQSTQATIGNGTIQTTSSLSGLNRDIGVTQKMTKDQKTGGLNVNLTIDNAVFANPVAYFAPIVELPQNAAGAAKSVGAELRIKSESTWDAITGKSMQADHRAYRDAMIRENPLSAELSQDYWQNRLALDQVVNPNQYVAGIGLNQILNAIDDASNALEASGIPLVAGAGAAGMLVSKEAKLLLKTGKILEEAKVAADLKILSPGEIRLLKNAGEDIHALKGSRAARFDLYKDKAGDIYRNLKGGKGVPDKLDINIKDYK